MNNNKALAILKAFYLGSDDMALISKRTKVSREEVREVLRGARECGLIEYGTKDYRETFYNIKKKKLGIYLSAKGVLN